MIYPVIKEDISLVTTDGVRLDADLYRPESLDSFPVLLMRQPYGRQIASSVVYAHPKWYASQGYLVVIQDVRGCGTSEGDFTLFEKEIEDGFETVNWAANLRGSSGLVGMYGFSYQGMTQLYAAANSPKPLKTICPAMAPYDVYEDLAYENDVFYYELNLAWAIQLAAIKAKKIGDHLAYKSIYLASKSLPVHGLSLQLQEHLRQYAPSNFYYQWQTLARDHPYWLKISPKSFLESLDLPMLHIGGAFDTYLRGTLKLYQAMSDRSKYHQSLIVGPWSHLPWTRKVAEIDYGPEASSNIDKLQIDWFDTFLKGKRNNFTSVNWFQMGSNQWISGKSLNQGTEQIFFLSSEGLANIREDNGKLVLQIPKDKLTDVIVHDPWRPVPSLGGHASLLAGTFERSNLDSRSDVLTYTSEPLQDGLSMIGDIRITLELQVDNYSFSLAIILSQVTKSAKIYNFSQGFAHFSRSSRQEISLQPTYYKIPPGDSLRLSISASYFPSMPLNPELTTLNLLSGKISLKIQ
jgi:hypothetical protein